MNLRKKGNQAESLVIEYLKNKGYTFIEQNFTIRGGELDIIVEDNNSRIFVEVKDVDNTQDLHNYISPKKISTILKTILFFNQRHPTEKQLRVDLVFVKQNTILHHYENITNQ